MVKSTPSRKKSNAIVRKFDHARAVFGGAARRPAPLRVQAYRSTPAAVAGRVPSVAANKINLTLFFWGGVVSAIILATPTSPAILRHKIAEHQA